MEVLAVLNVPTTMSIRERLLFPVPRNPASRAGGETMFAFRVSVKPRDVNYFYDYVWLTTQDSALVTPYDAYALHLGKREKRKQGKEKRERERNKAFINILGQAKSVQDNK